MDIQIELKLVEISEFSKILSGYFGDYTILGLTGDLGSGKTTFTKSLVKSLGIQENVTSPTYSIENEYYSDEIKILVRHIDLYRGLGDYEINEIFERRNTYGKEIVIIEWANLLSSFPNSNYLEINFDSSENIAPSSRLVKLTGNIGFFRELEHEIQVKYGKK